MKIRCSFSHTKHVLKNLQKIYDIDKFLPYQNLKFLNIENKFLLFLYKYLLYEVSS